MSSESIPVQALIEHRDFVRELARRLMGDAHAAEDVVQDATLAALRSASNAPSAFGAPRAWITRVVRRRALDEKRERRRRLAREAQVARRESTHDVDLAEKLELESRVVRAVLALREPYRAVMLGRYYQGLSTRELATRQGVTESSVRSQETRALELLRRELDQRFDGGRKAWSAALIGFVDAPKSSFALGSTAAWLLGAAACIGAVASWLDASRTAGDPPLLQREVAAIVRPAESVHDADNDRDPSQRAKTRARTPVATPQDVEPTESQLAVMTIPDLLQLGRQLQRELRSHLLAADPTLVAPHLPPNPDASYGSCRVVDALKYSYFADNETLLGVDGGGAWYSFVNRSGDVSDEPQVLFQGGKLEFMGAGLDLGECRLADFPASVSVLRPEWSAHQIQVWRALWFDAHMTKDTIGRGIETRCTELGVWRGALVPVVGHTYALRALNPREFDVLLAFTVVALDADGVALAWRILRQWDVVERRPLREPLERQRIDALAPAAPEWMRGLPVDALLSTLARVRRAAKPRLLDVAPVWISSSPSAPDRGGVIRLLPRGEFDTLVEEPGGGAYYSFATATHRSNLGDDLELDHGLYWVSVRTNSPPLIVDLGPIDLADLDARHVVAPDGLSDTKRGIWDLIWRLRCAEPGSADYVDCHPLTASDERRVQRLDAGKALAVTGHTYLLRSIYSCFDGYKHDVTVAFRTLAIDDYGHTLAWKLLRELPVPQRAR